MDSNVLSNGTLVLQNIKKSHEGSYICRASNALARIEAKVKINSPVTATSCSVIKKYASSVSGNYVIDPDGEGGVTPFTVFCEMADKSGVGVTVISHDSESSYNSIIFRNGGIAWWVSRDSTRMNYWGGASPGSGKCACGMTTSCADSSYGCNCDKNDYVWREDSGLLTDKTKLPVKQLRFGDVSGSEEGYHTLGKLKCFVLHEMCLNCLKKTFNL